MFSRIMLSLAIAWAVLLAPALCAGGVLMHECSTCGPAETCQHETGCDEDPCSPVLTRSSGVTRVPTELVPAELPPAAELVIERHTHGRWESPQRGHRPPPRSPRYCDSGLPLLN